MAFRHGKKAAMFFGQFNATAFLNSMDINRNISTADTTTFGDDAKKYVASSIQDASLNAGGLWDGDAGQLDLVMNSIMDANVEVPVTECPDGAVIGRAAHLAAALDTTYSVSTPIGGAVAVKVAAQASGGAWWGKVLHATASITGTVTGTSQDNTTATIRGGRGNIHVVSNSRSTNIDVKFQHSTDNTTWVDLTGGQQTVPAGVAISGSFPYGTPTGYTLSVAGTVNRYVRCLITPTAGTGAAIITMAFARY